MPIVRLELAPGRTLEEVTRIAVETIKCKLESIDVVIIEVPKSNWAKGGQLLSD